MNDDKIRERTAAHLAKHIDHYRANRKLAIEKEREAREIADRMVRLIAAFKRFPSWPDQWSDEGAEHAKIWREIVSQGEGFGRAMRSAQRHEDSTKALYAFGSLDDVLSVLLPLGDNRLWAQIDVGVVATESGDERERIAVHAARVAQAEIDRQLSKEA